MKTVFRILSWIFGSICVLLFILSLLSGHYFASIFILLAGLILIPPIRSRMQKITGFAIRLWLRILIVAVFLVLFLYIIFSGMGNKHSIYKSPEIKFQLMTIYKNRMVHWPVPYEDRYIQTRYGKVYVIMCGEESAAPLVLLHASAMASWSWLYNVAGLAKKYRLYAIDTIGDAGRSTLDDVSIFPADGRSLAALYTELMDTLGMQKAAFVGASQGGFIATNIALYAQDRVEHLILCGPMGYGGTTTSVIRIVFTTMFPLRPIQESTTRWAFGKDQAVNQAVGDWFRLILNGVISRQARPSPFSRDQLKRINVPVLLLLGTRDGLVGNPEKTIELVRDIPNFRVELLNTGHLISAERPNEFNSMVIHFINHSGSGSDKGNGVMN
jgi:pimeloyl-ACP methyl ester carboxylesterase